MSSPFHFEVRGQFRTSSAFDGSVLAVQPGAGIVRIVTDEQAGALERARAISVNGRWFVPVPADLVDEWRLLE